MNRLMIVAGALLAALAGGIAFAAIPGASGVVSACRLNVTGILRAIDVEKGQKCTSFESPVSWNVQGPKGEQGDKGDPGPQGLTGPPGPATDFGTGVGLEKVVLSAPPPVGDQTVLQLTSGYRLPQQCETGAVARKSSGAAWVCGTGSGSETASHVYIARQVPTGIRGTRLSGTDVVLAAVTVPAGSYLITGEASVENFDGDPQGANCKLSTGGISSGVLPNASVFEDSFPRQTIPVQDAATFAVETTVNLTCATFDGNAMDGVLTVLSVGGIN